MVSNVQCILRDKYKGVFTIEQEILKIFRLRYLFEIIANNIVYSIILYSGNITKVLMRVSSLGFIVYSDKNIIKKSVCYITR